VSLLASVVGTIVLLVLFGVLVFRRAKEVHASWRTALLAVTVGVALVSAAFVGGWYLMQAVY
jgi:hypothetical protein